MSLTHITTGISRCVPRQSTAAAIAAPVATVTITLLSGEELASNVTAAIEHTDGTASFTELADGTQLPFSPGQLTREQQLPQTNALCRGALRTYYSSAVWTI